MVAGDEIEFGPRVFFTEPWDPVVVRRGDALGLRALADQFADAIAPDLSNRVRDGRWVTILAWCLARSHQMFRASGGNLVASRAEQRRRYAWLRPLELMWVARTIAILGKNENWKNRPLSGQRRVRAWYEDSNQHTNRFGMSVDQFRAYRQTGMYGGYRLVFRKWPDMTKMGDGWTPGAAVIGLAKWFDRKLNDARPSWPLHAGDGDNMPKPNSRSQGAEHDWWLRNWKCFDVGGRSAVENTLPRQKTDFSVLPEFGLLKPLAFGGDTNGRLRLNIAREVARSSAQDHSGVCNHLGRVYASDLTIALLPRLTIALLPRFSRLADAGMNAMDLVGNSLQNRAHVELSAVAASPEAEFVCGELMDAARDWCKNAQIPLRHIEAAHRFAQAIPSAHPIDCLRALLQHHEMYGGGLRWFFLRNDRVEPRSPWRGRSSRYRFRLWSLCRLATQCGVLTSMPSALLGDDEAKEDETSEAGDD